MAYISRNFTAGKMNKSVDERLVPDGEYIDAMNVRMGSTEKSEVGVIENTKGNLPLSNLSFNGSALSSSAKCIGAIDDSARETIYWFVHDPDFASSPTGKIDLIVSFNVFSSILTYHVISVNDGGGVDTTLNFNSQYLITGVDLVEDLLFFTDDYNPPRFININSSYSNPTGSPLVDGAGNADLLYESLLVIKKPPTAAPNISLINTVGQQNFLKDRFISFAYRYKYSNNEYSATSQWSEVAFIPKSFDYSSNTYLNEGMTNEYNSVNIEYNSGSSLVTGIDLLFKESDSNIIKVIEKIDKSKSGISDNTNYSYLFTNSKIYTILNESELLRLYDNVPRLAKAQTIMGNRLLYGNYLDGYNVNSNIDYFLNLSSESINTSIIPASLSYVAYNIDSTPHIVNDASLILDLNGFNLKKGSLIQFEIVFRHDSFTGSVPPSTPTTSDTRLNFAVSLINDYPSVYNFATSNEFLLSIGTSLPSGNIQPVYNPSPGGNDSCDGNTFTDRVNCIIPISLGTYLKYESGINFPGEAILITTSPSLSTIQISLISMRFVDNPSSITTSFYEYYKIISYSALYSSVGVPKSLHSNRSYEIGIVYMDEFNRSTTTICSPNNTIFIPCSNSIFSNYITVNIPVSQVAPSWAKRYKFVCKADMAGYETIYSTIYFNDVDNQNISYFLLDGENSRKIEVGDRLIAKTDSSGPLGDCVFVTVIKKEALASGVIATGAPAGVYMTISSSQLNVVTSSITTYEDNKTTVSPTGQPEMELLLNTPGTDPLHPTWQYIDYPILAGSKVELKIKNSRNQWDDFFANISCPKYVVDFYFDDISNFSYPNFYQWFIGDNIEQLYINPNFGAIIYVIPGLANYGSPFPPNPPSYDPFYDILIRFERDIVTNKLILRVKGFNACQVWFPDNFTYSYLDGSVKTNITTSNICVFETMPLDTLPDVFFENNLSFPIDSNGNHLSNGALGDQSQNISLNIPAIIKTNFFNCFSYGNGVESYKIRDSILGRGFNLGERITTVASEDYKEFRRIADITYSGVFNPETNINKLNEFNSGLLNYKNLELSFGAIQLIDGRETDVLVLQEDKISYVLAGKNLLSDAAAGGVITSIPEVLGTQIARVEKYGISFNPESYVQWGFERFFTDAKRGAVLSLRGNSSQNDQLNVISEMGMRSWFRDTFNSSFNTQKLGAYDPYLNEYVLSTNDVKIPIEEPCIGCGTNRTFYYAQGEGNTSTYDFCVNLNSPVGDVNVTWNVVSIDLSANFEVDVTYNGTTYNSGIQTSSGSLTFTKNLPNVNECSVSIIANGNVAFDFNLSCPVVDNLTVIKIVLTNDNDSGQITLIQGRYEVGSYVSPLDGSWVVFASGSSNPLVSSYQSTYGAAGTGYIPIAGSTYTMINNKIYPSFVNFNFDVLTDKFKYLRTNVLYGNNSAHLNALLPLLNNAGPITQSGNIHQAQFTVDPTSAGQYLYLVWDYRAAEPVQLCYTANPAELYDICCDCSI